MKVPYGILVFLTLIFGCKRPFAQNAEAALALPLTTEKQTESVVFITGFDEGDNRYYSNAKRYFKEKGIRVIDNLFSMEDIIRYLNLQGGKQEVFNEIHIVSHSNAWLGMSLKTSTNGERITLKTLRGAKLENSIPALKNGITSETKIIFHSCGLGENRELLQELKSTFTAAQVPDVYASTYFNVFGGKFAGHYLAKPYYVFYPTAESPGPAQLANDMKLAYPQTQIDWFTALKTRQETMLGEAYSFKFNFPVDWEFSFENSADIPKFENTEVLLDWISESPEMAEVLFELNIPIEKYRWKTEIRGNKLMLKGKTTVLCVLAPILQENDSTEYQTISLDDHALYQIL